MEKLKTDYRILDDLIDRLLENKSKTSHEINELLVEAARAIYVLGINLSEVSTENYQAKHTVSARDACITYLKGRLDNAGIGYLS